MKKLITILCKRTFKRLGSFLILIFAFIFIFCLTKVYSQGGPPVGTGNWTQTFNEDFKGITMASDKRSFTTLDGNTWITTFFWGTGAIGDGSLNYYTGNNVSCDGNNLVMKVSQELAAGAHPFAGGLANTDPSSGGSFSQQYGYYELRVKISMTNGDASYASVPPVNHAWPPETEMFESPYAWGQNGQRIHFLEKTTSNDGALTYDFGAGFHLQDAFHTIGYLWEPDYVVFYVDGIERGRSSWTSHSEPSFLNIGHGCGSDGGIWNGDAYAGTWPQNTYFDYFKVWTKNGSGTKVFVAPAAPTAISGDGKIAVSWSGSAGASGFNVKRSTTSGGSYSTIATVTSPFYMDNSVSNNTTYYYVVSGVKSGSETGNSKEASAKPVAGTNGTKLVGYGTVCGEPYSGSSDGYRAYDGDPDTYFDYITPNGAQTGMDLGSGVQATLSKIRFYPRGGFEGRMTGGKFQGSNDNISFTDLYTISTQPSAGWNEVIVTSGSYRYFRYLSPIDSYGNVNEIEYYGTSSNNNVSVTGVSVTPASATINVGSTQQLTATVIPSNATNKAVSWSSNNTGVATVNSSGLITGVAAGSSTITVTTVDGSKTTTSAITVTGGSGTSIPAKIQAESYSSMLGIATETTTDTGGGLNVGWTDTGDWMNYSVNASAGTYTVDLRVASPNAGSQIQIKSGSTVLATVTVPNTGGWQTWQTVTSSSFSLAAGSQTLQVYASVGGWNLNWLEFKSGGTPGGNLIQNPGFETGNFSPWINVWQSSITTGNAHTGSYCVTSWSGGSATQTVTVTPNTSYTLTFWGKLNGAGTASIYVKNYGGADLSAAITTTSYAQKTISFTTGSSNTTVLISVNAPSAMLYADDFSLTASDAASTLKSGSVETALINPAKSVSDIAIKIYPNPITEQTAVWVNSSEAVSVSVNICNVMGQIVWSIKTYALGDTKIPIDLNGQAKGIYVVKVQIGEKVVSKTIVK